MTALAHRLPLRLGRPRLRLRPSTALLLVFVGAWWFALRPAELGGATGYIFVSGTSMEPGMHTGDLVLTRRQSTYRVGDVVAFRVPARDVGAGAIVIHRIVGGSAGAGWVLRGDNRDADDLWRPRDGDIVGKAAVHVPKGGAWLGQLRNPLVLALLTGLVTWFSVPTGRRRRRPDAPSGVMPLLPDGKAPPGERGREAA